MVKAKCAYYRYYYTLRDFMVHDSTFQSSGKVSVTALLLR